ncbi:MAG TPA: alpha-amylase family glycosyl hydrolase [Prolixibacteraceae bacterium]|nr:alpha-amylase family glycosyl hydrolase [Prolixibacteraceae bacterium]
MNVEQPKYPTLYQVNTRVWLTELSHDLGRPATLDDIPESELDALATRGFDWIWLLSVWTTGHGSRKISLQNPEWRREFEETLPDLKDEDIGGSGFAITAYNVHPEIGGNAALKRLRAKLSDRGLRLMLDFVPNHMGPDHPWVEQHPDYFVPGTEDDLRNYPQNYTLVKRKKGDMILAYGRDPFFAGWPDTLQLDYSNPETLVAMTRELQRISRQCDGVRCDMAMLILPEVFERTWGRAGLSFWPETIKTVHAKVPGFCFMAEVYWDLEWTLQQLGFNYTYDKRLYDRLNQGLARPVREHFLAEADFQDRLARFMENHDEPRAASVFEQNKHKAAAVITYLSPGLRFLHQGQPEGREKRISPHLVRAPEEQIRTNLQEFYAQLLSILRKPVFRDGIWRLCECAPAWEGNGSWDSFLAFAWEAADGSRALVVVNYSVNAGQCYVNIPFTDIAGKLIRFKDLMSTACYDRAGTELIMKGLYLDLTAWGYHVFEINNTK